MRGNDGLPVFLARRTGTKRTPLLTFKCPRCGQKITHGTHSKPGSGDGHRTSHCKCWKPDGYYIEEELDMLPDEACHLPRGKIIGFRSEAEVAEAYAADRPVTLHNTMRFDLRLQGIVPSDNISEADKSELVRAVRTAIVVAVQLLYGQQVLTSPEKETRSKLLHRETIHLDFIGANREHR